MGKTTALRAVIKTALADCGCPVYYGAAQGDDRSDYVIYSVDEVMREDGRITFETEVNVVGYGTDTSRIEDRADYIQKVLDKKVVHTDSISVYFYADAKNTVNEEDRQAIRRRLTFSTYLYERE